MNTKATIIALGVLLAACQETVRDPDWLACANDLYGPACPAERRAKICAYQKEHPDSKQNGVTLDDCNRFFGLPDADAGESPDADATPADATSPEAGGPSCARDRDCPASAPVCSEGTCSACETSAACSARADTPVCSAGACVACTASEPGACAADGEVCVTGGTTCAACNTNAECPSPSASRCLENACAACEEDADCGHLETKVCAEGVCVECTPNAEDARREACPDGRACHPSTLTCTAAPRGSLDGCAPCVSDSECVVGTRCVPTLFQGAAHGSYCLLQYTGSPCPSQYKAQREATSTLRVTAEYCFPNDAFTTCEGVRDFGTLCTPDTAAACGDDSLPNDAVCTPQGACSYGCDSDRDCSGTDADRCFGPPGAKYCKTN